MAGFPDVTKITEFAAATLDSVVAPDLPCALIDFPDHPNVGDSAIWLGERIYLSRRRAQIRYVCSVDTFSEKSLRALMPRGTILIHGGGNFGTLWDWHQALREKVLTCFTDYPVIQLPQTLYFEDPDSLRRVGALVRKHPDFTLLVRDSASLRIAREGLGIEAILCPDSAFFLEGMLSRGRKAVQCYGLCRTDKERQFTELPDVLRALDLSVDVDDWLEEPRNYSSMKGRVLSYLVNKGIARKDAIMSAIVHSWDEAARQRVARGCRQLSRGEFVVTDRLHAQILCILLGIPNIALDNNNQKVANFFDDWLGSIDVCRRVDSLDDLPAAAGQLYPGMSR